jgi:serum/glucocorticoid-regulated kinase 2
MNTTTAIMSGDPDALGLQGKKAVQTMLARYQADSKFRETVRYSNFITKINKRRKEQHRAILITDRAIYNLSPNQPGTCKRRIELSRVLGITSSTTSPEFVIHVPDEYDYRYKSTIKEDIFNVITEVYRALDGKAGANLVTRTDEKNLEGVTMLKATSNLMDREERILRRNDFLQRLLQKDQEDEEKEATEKKFTSALIETKEKVTLRDFQLKKVLGRGSFGKVMLVRKKDTGQYFAMKILKKDFIIKRNQVDHTKAERKILQQLQHPFLMKLRYAFQSQAKLYLVLDFYQGGELFFHLKTNRRFTEQTAKVYVGEIALALGYLHSLGVIYRDLKPENILLDPEGHVCLTDFGLAKELEDGEQTGSFCGTPEYLAPEIVAGGQHDKAVDWWSLGILLYELTVGIPPFYSQNTDVMYKKIEQGVLRFPPFLTDNCKSLIVDLLNRNPAERCGSLDDVEDIKRHAFFADVDWDAMFRKEILPDFTPDVQQSDPSALFENVFTDERPVETLEVANTLVNNNQAAFQDFTFVGNTEITE